MCKQIRWNSQPLDVWREKYAKGKFIDLKGHLTHYIEKGEGPPVILLHGWFHDSQMWNMNIDVLAQKFRVYAIDFWGFGYSTRKMMDWNYELYLQQLQNFIDNLGIQRASLIGHCMGAGVSQLFCTHHRERVNKLVLVSPAGLPNPSPLIDEAAVQRCLRQLMTNQGKSRRLLLDTMFIYQDSSLSDEYFAELTRFHEIAGTNEVLISNLKNNFFDGLSTEIKHLGEMDVPILIVWGRHDKAVTPGMEQKMNSMLRSSQLEIFEESAHCANYEQPDKFNSLVMNFLSGYC